MSAGFLNTRGKDFYAKLAKSDTPTGDPSAVSVQVRGDIPTASLEAWIIGQKQGFENPKDT